MGHVAQIDDPALAGDRHRAARATDVHPAEIGLDGDGPFASTMSTEPRSLRRFDRHGALGADPAVLRVQIEDRAGPELGTRVADVAGDRPGHGFCREFAAVLVQFQARNAAHLRAATPGEAELEPPAASRPVPRSGGAGPNRGCWRLRDAVVPSRLHLDLDVLLLPCDVGLVHAAEHRLEPDRDLGPVRAFDDDGAADLAEVERVDASRAR